MTVLNVRADWDPEAEVFVVTSDDLPGLATEASTIDEVFQKLEVMLPELIEENGVDMSDGEPPVIDVIAHKQVSLLVA